MEPDRIFIDFREEKLTMMQVMERVRVLQAENPDYEIFMDGDRFAIVGRRKPDGQGKDNDRSVQLV
jgi:hypothetical protein